MAPGATDRGLPRAAAAAAEYGGAISHTQTSAPATLPHALPPCATLRCALPPRTVPCHLVPPCPTPCCAAPCRAAPCHPSAPLPPWASTEFHRQRRVSVLALPEFLLVFLKRKNKCVGVWLQLGYPTSTNICSLEALLCYCGLQAPQKRRTGITRDISQMSNLLFLPQMPLVAIIIQASTSVFLIYLYLT